MYNESASHLISFNVIMTTDHDKSTEINQLNVPLFNNNDTTQIE